MIQNIEGLKIKVRIEDGQFELPQEISNKIDVFWENAKKDTPGLWNGELMCVGEYRRQGDEIFITCKKSNYSHYLYDERIGLSNQYACSSLVAGCLLETSDGYYIVGELADNTSFPHCMQVSGGSADYNDIEDGEIDIYNTIIRECEEELNIKLQNKEQVEHFEIKYISLPEKAHQYILFAKGKLTMTKAQMEQYYQDYLKYLQDNNLEIEFSKIYFIKKGRTSQELQKFKNPKRDYLEDLLQIDSRENELKRE